MNDETALESKDDEKKQSHRMTSWILDLKKKQKKTNSNKNSHIQIKKVGYKKHKN